MTNSFVSFSAVGDISFGDHPLCAGIGTHSKLKNKDPDFPFEKVKSEFQKADILFGNLECTLSRNCVEQNNYHSTQMRGQTEYINSLTNAGFTVLNHANNHSLQHGKQAFTETVNLVENSGIKMCGVNINDHCKGLPEIIESNGLRIAFIGYSLRPRQYFEYTPLYTEGNSNNIRTDIENIKNDVDIVIISLHWGDEFILRPSPEEIKLAREIIDSGADLIIGHHPHVVRGIEKYKNGYIVYSLGNFVCDMVWDETLRQSIIFNCKIDKDGIRDIKLTPIYINNNCQPEILTGSSGDELINRISGLSESIVGNKLSDFDSQMNIYQSDADEILRITRKKSQVFFLSRLRSYPKLILVQQILSYIKNRINEFRGKQ